MRRSTKTALSVAFLIIFMSIGFSLLLITFTGSRLLVFAIFLIYLFVLYFLILTTRRFFLALRESEKKDEEK
ncbi:MAG TPA: hypothetical protein IAB12_02620 [Candidatus Ornithospirochaeta avicola]|uniref:Uncharacterized protein n=1 Tax=Candidatus Ornithospirochaeta avicola TaxID=2840896 RepID=A0A9D1PSS1_9SPIO|nr:hypothetical protein [Candidatus Ornithospirochaeta avicola]